MLELGIVVALALAIWLAVAKPVKFTGLAAKAGAAADEATGGIKDSHKKTLGKVVKLVLAALVIAFILYYDWSGTAVGKRLVGFLGTENADLFDTLVMVPMFLIVAILLSKFWGGSENKAAGSKKKDGSVVGWIAGVVIALGSVGIIAYFATSAVTTISGHINGNPVVQVDLSRSKETFGSQEGKTVTKKMDIRGEMAVRLRTINHTKEGRYSTWPCPSAPALKSVGVMYEIVRGGGSPVNVIALTAESQKKLFDMGIVSVDTSVTSVKAPYGGETPCQYLVDPRK